MSEATSLPPLTGGCLCGHVRYEARPDHREGYYCHCRMCQLAFGNTRAAFLNLRKDEVTWTTTPPTTYASSKIARRAFRAALIALILVGGLAGFFLTYSGYFKKGATSVGARFDYWRAAMQTARDHPIVGTGPGTFAHPYAQIKRPESEMARLVHNDYLEQASDSGLPGFLLYTTFLVCALVWTFPRTPLPRRDDNQTQGTSRSATEAPELGRTFCIWLGVLGWALQGLFDFDLYIPALAWPAFAFLGLLFASRKSEKAAEFQN
jgi:O-antigen ligase